MLTNFSLSAFAGPARLAIRQHGFCGGQSSEGGLHGSPAELGLPTPPSGREITLVCTLASCRDLGGTPCTRMGFTQIYLHVRCCVDYQDRSSWRFQGALKRAVKGKFKVNKQGTAL